MRGRTPPSASTRAGAPPGWSRLSGEHGLVDAYQLWLHPVVLGGGKRLFADDSEISKVRREAASYRRKLRVEAERDKLAARLGDVQRAEVERFGEALKGRRAKGWPLAPRRIGGDCVGDVTVGPAGSE